MKILLISDEESSYLWDFYQPGKLDGIDLILSCGDLSPEYLSFLVTMGRAPLLYVHGNHDGKYAVRPPEGCECIEDRVVNFNGVRILGLGGSLRYSPGDHQYTEGEMEKRIQKLQWQIKRHKGVDIVVTHAPVRGIGDEDSHVHRGFEAFHKILKQHHPSYWAYGHVHLRYSNQHKRVIEHEGTQLINACERYTIEVQPKEKKGLSSCLKNLFAGNK